MEVKAYPVHLGGADKSDTHAVSRNTVGRLMLINISQRP